MRTTFVNQCNYVALWLENGNRTQTQRMTRSEVNRGLCTCFVQALSGSKIKGWTKAIPRGQRNMKRFRENEKHKQPPAHGQTQPTSIWSGSWGGCWRRPLPSPSQEHKVTKSALAAITGREAQITALLFDRKPQSGCIVRSPVEQKGLWLPNTIKSIWTVSYSICNIASNAEEPFCEQWRYPSDVDVMLLSTTYCE